MTPDDLLRELLDARARRERCALVTVAAARGSTPREAGAKMLVYAGGRIAGTVGGGRLESLIIEESVAALAARAATPALKIYPLREGLSESFGAVCGGEPRAAIAIVRAPRSARARAGCRPGRHDKCRRD